MDADQLKSIVSRFKRPGVRWKKYPNPMRADGVFIAEDKAIEPYPGVTDMNGYPLFPVIPKTENTIPFQISLEDADEVLAALN